MRILCPAARQGPGRKRSWLCSVPCASWAWRGCGRGEGRHGQVASFPAGIAQDPCQDEQGQRADEQKIREGAGAAGGGDMLHKTA
jgi:hypothetical protein